jgi:hypothetical protein
MSDAKVISTEHHVDIAAGIIFSVISCGIYNIYWNYRQMKAMNELLAREEFDFGKWAILTVLSCGIYHIYYEYRMGAELQAWLTQNGHPVNPHLAVIGLLLSVFGLTVVADAVYQQELNKLT